MTDEVGMRYAPVCWKRFCVQVNGKTGRAVAIDRTVRHELCLPCGVPSLFSHPPVVDGRLCLTTARIGRSQLVDEYRHDALLSAFVSVEKATASRSTRFLI